MSEPATDAAPPAAAVKTLKSFVAKHGASTAVVSYLGQRGARIVLVGADGTWGDQVVPDVAAGTAACAAAGITVTEKWSRELTESVRTSGVEWGRMGRGRPVRDA